MAELRETHTIIGPFLDEDPLDTALLFLRTNGYRLLESEQGPRPAGLEVQPRSPAPSTEGEASETSDGDEPADDEDEGHVDAVEASADETAGGATDGEDDGVESLPEDEDADDHATIDAEPSADVTLRLHLERGSKSSGWFSSNLAELFTDLDVRLEGNVVRVAYRVTTTGQHLWNEEKEFWKREARALEEYLKVESDIPNLAQEAREHAFEVRKDFARVGCFIGALVGLFLFVFLMALLK